MLRLEERLFIKTTVTRYQHIFTWTAPSKNNPQRQSLWHNNWHDASIVTCVIVSGPKLCHVVTCPCLCRQNASAELVIWSGHGVGCLWRQKILLQRGLRSLKWYLNGLLIWKNSTFHENAYILTLFHWGGYYFDTPWRFLFIGGMVFGLVWRILAE